MAGGPAFHGAASSLAVAEVVRLLELKRHPEGGFFRETFRDARRNANGRAVSTAIYYLLPAGEISHWHKVDAVEVWHFHAGAPLLLTLSADGRSTADHRLGPDLSVGDRPQVVVPADVWQTAKSLGAWTLAGCTVAPGFTFDGFAMAPKDWQPRSSGA